MLALTWWIKRDFTVAGLEPRIELAVPEWTYFMLYVQYFPKGTDISGYSQAHLNAVARQLDARPRKTLNYETPAERFSQSVASIS